MTLLFMTRMFSPMERSLRVVLIETISFSNNNCPSISGQESFYKVNSIFQRKKPFF
jgi:hypothetical protein